MGAYQPQDYVIYISLLLIILWLLRKYFFSRVKIDKDFIYAISPYILVGTFIRIMVDIRFFERNNLWNITPGVYLLTAAIALTAIFLGMYLQKKTGKPYWITPLLLGVILVVPLTYEIVVHLIYPERVLYPLIMSLILLSLVYITSSFFHIQAFQSIDNVAIIFAHLLDGCATFIAINYYNFSEEHLLPMFLISIAGDNAFIMVPTKLILILVVVYLFEKWHTEDKEADDVLYKEMKLLLFILGIGPGIRDTLLPALIS